MEIVVRFPALNLFATTSDALSSVNSWSVTLFNFVGIFNPERATLQSQSKTISSSKKLLTLARVLYGEWSIDAVDINCAVNSTSLIFVKICFISNQTKFFFLKFSVDFFLLCINKTLCWRVYKSNGNYFKNHVWTILLVSFSKRQVSVRNSHMVTNIKLGFCTNFVELFEINNNKARTCFRVTLFEANFVTLFTR